jgi:hypothetical protein
MSATATNFAANHKTVMCLYAETGCPRASTCIFAHSIEELRPRMCPHGNTCRFDRRKRNFDQTRRPCGFFHPGEKITPEEIYKRVNEFSVAKPVPMPGTTSRTKLCSNWQTCRKDDCPCAHSKEELSPAPCKFGYRCFFNPKNPRYDPSRKPCQMHHPGDVICKDQLFEKELHRLAGLKKLEASIPQFTVNLSEEDDDEEEEEAPPVFSVSSWADDEEEVDFSTPLKM